MNGVGGDVPVEGGPTHEVMLDAAALKPGRKYAVRVQALDMFGHSIRKPDSSSSASESLILASWPFTYEPPPVPDLSVKVRAVSPDWQTNKLLINLDVQTTTEVLKYEAAVTKAGQMVAQWGPALYTGAELKVDLPEQMRLPTPREYKLGVTLWAQGAQPVFSEFEFTLDAAPQPGLGERIWDALSKNPGLLAVCVVAAAFVLTWYTLGSRRKKKRADTLTPPPVHRTGNLAVEPQVRLRVRLLHGPPEATWSERTVRRFPFVIGRNGSDLDIPDPKVSSLHLKVELRNGTLQVSSLGRNGTWLDGKKLETNLAAPLTRTTCVKLGPETEIELSPEA